MTASTRTPRLEGRRSGQFRREQGGRRALHRDDGRTVARLDAVWQVEVRRGWKALCYRRRRTGETA